MNTTPRMIRISSRFGVKPVQTTLIKSGVWRLTAPGGALYCLKRMRYSEARIRWIDQVLLRLREEGCKRIAWRDPEHAFGKPLFVRPHPKQAPYILTPWISGQEAEPTSPQDLRLIAGALARFHQAGTRSLPDLSTAGAHNGIGTWPDVLKQRRSVLLREMRKDGGDPEMARLLHTHGNLLLSRAERALRTLSVSDYRSLCSKAARQGALCHGDSGPKNFVLAAEGPYLIDFETLRLDLRVYDLFRMIRLACRHRGWQFAAAQAILDGYNDVSELAPAEYELLGVWLQFPHKVTRVLAQYLRAGEAARRQLTAKVRRAVEDERNIDDFLRQLDDYAKKG